MIARYEFTTNQSEKSQSESNNLSSLTGNRLVLDVGLYKREEFFILILARDFDSI